MRKVTLNKIELTNFKGFAQAEKFFGTNERISAENGQGKTTLRDAWFWLLGFNVTDVIPCHNNKEIPNLEIKVCAEITIGDNGGECSYILCRTQKELWKTNRDAGIEEKVNNESAYFIDGTPFTLRAYKEKIAELFAVPYEKLQMLCQKEYFNTDNGEKWKWTNRRKELFEIGKVDELLLDLVNKECYCLIAGDIKKKYTTTEIKKAIRKELSGYSAEKDKNAILIADKQNELAKYAAYDFAALEAEKATLESQITDAMLAGSKKVQNERLLALQDEQSQITQKVYSIRAENARQTGDLQNKISYLSGELSTTQRRAESLKADMATAQSAVENLEAETDALSKKEWNGETTCPTCGQPLLAERVEESKQLFEKEKAAKLETFSKNIDERFEFLTTAKKQLSEYRTAYAAMRDQKTAYEQELAKLDISEQMKPLNDRLAEIAKEIAAITAEDRAEHDVSAVIEPLKRRVAEINSILGYKRLIADMTARIEALKALNKEFTDKEMTAKEKVRQLDDYVREQVQLVTDVINSKFGNGVSFSLFSDLYAGSEHEIKEECICVLRGKTYTEMSYGERFFADLEVTKSLQEQYGVNLPIFLDNAECYTGDFTAEQQLISLYAKKGDYLPGVKIEVIL